MAIITPCAVRMLTGGSPVPVERGIEATSQNYKAGSPLATSSGKLAEAGTNPRDIVGFAINAATGTEDKEVLYVPAIVGVVFEITIDNAGSLGQVLAQSQLYAPIGITKDGTTGRWIADLAKTTVGASSNVVWLPIRHVDPLNTVQGRVHAVLLVEATAFKRADA